MNGFNGTLSHTTCGALVQSVSALAVLGDSTSRIVDDAISWMTCMGYSRFETEDGIVLSPPGPINGSVVWLHGLGETANHAQLQVEGLSFSDQLGVRFVLPLGQLRHIGRNNRKLVRSWCDIARRQGDTIVEDESGIRQSAEILRNLIEREEGAGIPADRIVLAGFSQGGSIAPHLGVRYPRPLAGIVLVSSFVALHGRVAVEASDANRSTPILLCHGRDDEVVPRSIAERSRDFLMRLGYAVAWKDYAAQHSMTVDLHRDLSSWIASRLALPSATMQIND
jgi:phospholipase/carboxylesterase